MNSIVQKCEFSIGNARIEIVMQGGFSGQGVQSSVDMHYHPNFEVHYIEYGEYVLKSGESVFEVSGSTLVIIPPKLYHSFQSNSERRKRLSFELRLTKLKKGTDVYAEYDSLFSSIEGAAVIEKHIPELITVSQNMGIINGEEEICRLKAYFSLSFLSICDILRKTNASAVSISSPSTAEVEPSDEDLTLIKILNVILKNCRRPLKLSEVAKAASLSERQIQRILSAKMGEGFHAILTKNRINAAKEMMADPDFSALTLDRIAYECGFSNYVSFWSQFKKFSSLTPEQYRASVLSKSQ